MPVKRGISYGFAQIKDVIALLVLSSLLVTIGILGIVSFSPELMLIGSIFAVGGFLVFFAGVIGLFYAMLEDAVRNGIHNSILASEKNTEILVEAITRGVNQSEMAGPVGNPTRTDVKPAMTASELEQSADTEAESIDAASQSNSDQTPGSALLEGHDLALSNERKEALADIVTHISKVGPVSTSNIERIFYHKYPLNFEHAGSWRTEFLKPTLQEVPGVRHIEENNTWKYTEDCSDRDQTP